jgi:Holliday junction resolvase
MASSEKRKGNAAERAVVDYLKKHGYPQARRTQAGTRGDIGDIDGVPGFAIEVKNHARLDLAGWVAQMLAEIDEKGVENGVVIAKKRGTSNPGDWYAITPLHLWSKMLPNYREED